jgi:hypothetical protein
MSDQELENLVKIKKLKTEACLRKEFDGYLKSGKNRLADAHNEDLSDDSRFDLAYSAAHAYAVAALRRKGYRSEDRYIVFQVLPHTAGLDAAKMRVFAKAHNERNLAEYQGRTEVDQAFLAELLAVTDELEKIVGALDPPA